MKNNYSKAEVREMLEDIQGESYVIFEDICKHYRDAIPRKAFCTFFEYILGSVYNKIDILYPIKPGENRYKELSELTPNEKLLVFKRFHELGIPFKEN